jgi:hypothetical protein
MNGNGNYLTADEIKGMIEDYWSNPRFDRMPKPKVWIETVSLHSKDNFRIVKSDMIDGMPQGFDSSLIEMER